MNIFFKQSFVKDFKKLPEEVKVGVRKICVEVFPVIQELTEVKELDIKPIKGFKQYYRIRLNNYRIGFRKDNHAVIFMRVKHRKDIYRIFP